MKKSIILFFLIGLTFAGFGQHPCSVVKQKGFRLGKKALATSTTVRLLKAYDVKYHELNLHSEDTNTYLEGSVRTLAAIQAEQLDTFAMELHSNLVVDSVIQNKNQRISFIRNAHAIYCLLPSQLKKGNLADLRVFYHGTPPSDASAAIGNGFSSEKSPTYGTQVTWSLSQPYAALEWWPCKQALDDKIDSLDIKITTSKRNKVGSNGKLISVIAVDDSSHQYHWKSSYPIDYYLVSIAIAPYIEVVDYAHPAGSSDSVLILHYLYNQKAYANNKANIDFTAQLLEVFSEKFGPYPFMKEKYGHSMAPFSGGMEHQTMTTQGVFPFDIIAHELGHQWFGDHVTCGSWSDLWLNEGLASYTEYIALEALKPGQEKQALADMQAYGSSGEESIFITDTSSVPRLFSSSLTYNKAGAVVHMLRYIVGDSAFFAGCKSYLKEFGGSTALTTDFKKHFEKSSGKNLNAFFDEWIYGAGYPSYKVDWNYENGNLHILSTQENAKSKSTLFTTPIQYRAYFASGDSSDIRVDGAKRNQIYFKGNVADSVVKLLPNPEKAVLMEYTLFKNNGLTGIQSKVEAAFDFNMYPNPASNQVRVELPNNYFEIRIYSLEGRLLFEETAFAEKTIQLEKMKGLVLVELKTPKGKSTKKLFIGN
ncbi:MAG: T9SS type A sorting domain-containing protein [Bacteroidia bacterium]|nr:T9SS type A sorting domain-containing protein [Bacteroidia bacterium]